MRAARLALPLAGAALGVVAATAFQPGMQLHEALSPCADDQVAVQLSPLYDLQRPGTATPVEAVRIVLDSDATAGIDEIDVGSLQLVGEDDQVRLLGNGTQVGLAATWELPAGGHAVDTIALCLPGGPP